MYKINGRWVKIHYTEIISFTFIKVNKEYVELYERFSSTDLANPVSYIDNALGIFTSMSVARVRFTVY